MCDFAGMFSCGISAGRITGYLPVAQVTAAMFYITTWRAPIVRASAKTMIGDLTSFMQGDQHDAKRQPGHPGPQV
jgi:hypothetical protein